MLKAMGVGTLEMQYLPVLVWWKRNTYQEEDRESMTWEDFVVLFDSHYNPDNNKRSKELKFLT